MQAKNLPMHGTFPSVREEVCHFLGQEAAIFVLKLLQILRDSCYQWCSLSCITSWVELCSTDRPPSGVLHSAVDEASETKYESSESIMNHYYNTILHYV